MIARFKNYNDSIFLVFLLVILSTSSWFFNHNMSEKISFLKGEVIKIDKQDLLLIKQNDDILYLKKQIQNQIDIFLKLQVSIQESKTEEIKEAVSKNTKSQDLLSILPPSEIANIQQAENNKKIIDDITTLKDKSVVFWKAISNIGSENFSNMQFTIGNISDTSLKKELSSDLTALLKKEKDLFNTVTSYDNTFKTFTEATDNLNSIYPLLKANQTKAKKTINSNIESLNKEREMIQLISLIGLFSLFSVFIFVFVIIKNKKIKLLVNPLHIISESFNPINNELNNELNNDLNNFEVIKNEKLKEATLYEKVISLLNNINQELNKQIHLDFDMENFNLLTLDQKNKLNIIVLELVKFSGLYSFDTQQTGSITISLKENNGNYLFSFNDNGKGISLEEIKEKIKLQYNVIDSVFIGKTDQQILSFIFKPGFVLIPHIETSSVETLQLNLISQLSKEINAKISLSTQQNNGTDFMLEFQSI